MYSIDQIIRLILNEAFLRRKVVLALVVAINALALVVALNWPEKYTSYTTIFVEERNIIEPLMQGAAVPTGVTDRARIAREVIYGRRVMHRLVDDLGWFGKGLSEPEKELIAERLKQRTTINNVGRAGLIRIEYADSDPVRAHQATKRIAELFIEESHEAKLRESEAAYEFISKQAAEYHAKLQQAEQQLKEFRSTNVDSGPVGEAGVANRISAIRTRLDQSIQELREAEIRKASLERQLSGETESALVFSREGQYRTRLSELQSQLDTLRLSFHDTHPDIVRVRHQIADLQEAIRAEQERRRSGARPDGGGAGTGEAAVHSPLYQQLRQELSQTRTLIDTLTARIQEARRQLDLEVERGRQVHGGEATLAELTRDYEVNRASYQDLSRRRESARVSMNLDRERQGLRFRLQEEAFVPVHPSGFGFFHIALAGTVLSLLAPVGLLFALVQLDPRLRLPHVIAKRANVPVLAVVPHLWTPGEAQALRREMVWGAAVLAGSVLTIVVAALVRASLVG